MKVDDSFLNIAKQQVSKQRTEELQKEKAANDFEEIFARHLVKEMTKDSFKMSDKNSVMGSSGSLYREHITDALAGELAKQRKLGMADLVTRYWSHPADEMNKNQPLNNEDAK
jgi:Rod binding domain-containing protein